MPIDRVHQFLIDAGLEPGEPSVLPPSVEPVVMTATAPERGKLDDRPYGVHRCPAPPGMIAIQAIDANGHEFGYFRIRANAFTEASFDRLANLLRHHCPDGDTHLKLVRD